MSDVAELPLQMKRPALRYHGGKWAMAPWIISHFPSHKVYVEPFGGADSVLLRKPPSLVEIYNDLDDDVVNFFRVLRDPVQAEELRRLCALTPFARSEFELARECGIGIEAARRLVFRSHAGFGSHSHNAANSNGFRASATQGKNYAREWCGIPDALEAITQRLRHVIIERRNAFDIIDRYNQADALLYVDPPYVTRTRDDHTKGYVHELTNAEHRKLAFMLRALKSKVVLSGYPDGLYEVELYADWRRVDREVIANGSNGGVKRTEVLWMNF